MTEHSADAASAVPREAIEAAADRLRRAAVSRTPCPPVRDLIGARDLAAGYAVQALLTRERVDAGALITGRKIGLTAAAVRAQLKVDQPDFGTLFADMYYPDGATVPHQMLLQPRVEAEVAFVMGADLADGDLGYNQVVDAVDYAVAALEICDSRILDFDITFVDTVADNASAGAYVLGDKQLRMGSFNPREVAMSMSVTGQPQSAGTGRACLGDPLLALQWLARQTRELDEPLQAGQVVLSGALGPMRALAPGGSATATFTQLGQVSVRLSAAPDHTTKEQNKYV